MKRVAAFVLLTMLLIPGVALAGSSTDAALGLGAFAVFNQILSGTGVFGAGRPAVVVQQPPAVIYSPPPAVVYAPPPVVYAPAPPPVYYVPAPGPVYAYPYAAYPHYRAHRWRHRHH